MDKRLLQRAPGGKRLSVNFQCGEIFGLVVAIAHGHLVVVVGPFGVKVGYGY